MTQFYRTKNSEGVAPQKQCFDNNPNCKFFVARDYQYKSKDGKSKVAKEYGAYSSISDFFEVENTFENKSFYEILKDERVAIFDIDGYYSNPIFQEDDGSPKSTESIIQEFIDAYTDFHEDIYPNLKIKFTKNNFLIKKTDDPENKKESLHIIVRNGYKFKDEKHLNEHCKRFKNYYKDNKYQVDIDMAIYSKNRCIRMLGHHKLEQKERMSYRYQNHTKYNINCNKDEFFASFLIGNEQYYPEFDKGGENKKEDLSLFKSSISISSSKDENAIEKLLGLILETIDNKESPICDDEQPTMLCYKNWYKLVLTFFNCINTVEREEFECRFFYEKLYYYYRNFADIDKEQYFNDLYSRKGLYTELTENSLHYLARFNPKYSEVFFDEITEFKEKLRIFRFERNLKKALELEESDEDLPINYISEFSKITKISKSKFFTKKYIEKIINNVCTNIVNGGNNSIFCRDRYYCHSSNSYLEKYTQVKYNKLASPSGHLNYRVREINQNFLADYKRYKEELKKLGDKKPPKGLKEPDEYEFYFIANSNADSICKNMMEHGRFSTASIPIFFPYLHEDDNNLSNYKNCLNLFTGFPFKINTNSVSTELYKNSLLRENVRKYLCNGDVEPQNFEYVEKHVAHMIQKPYERADMAIIMTGSQGTGKDLWCSHLSKLIGVEYFLDIASMSLLFKDFNASHGQKLLIRLNEISDKGEHFDKHNLLKEKITAERLRIENKGHDAYYINNYARYIGFSQNENVVFVEKDDRRFFMIKTNNDMANNQEYFSKIFEEIKNPEFLQSSFNYYATLDISDFNPRVFPETTYRDEQKVQSLPNHLKYFYHLFEDKTESSYKEHIDELYCNYNSWCIEYNIRSVCNKMTFKKEMKKLGIDFKRIQISRKRQIGIEITYDELQNLFRKYLKQPNLILPNNFES